MGDKDRPRLPATAFYWCVHVADLFSKRWDRMLDRLATARLRDRPPKEDDVELETLPPRRSMT